MASTDFHYVDPSEDFDARRFTCAENGTPLYDGRRICIKLDAPAGSILFDPCDEWQAHVLALRTTPDDGARTWLTKMSFQEFIMLSRLGLKDMSLKNCNLNNFLPFTDVVGGCLKN